MNYKVLRPRVPPDGIREVLIVRPAKHVHNRKSRRQTSKLECGSRVKPRCDTVDPIRSPELLECAELSSDIAIKAASGRLHGCKGSILQHLNPEAGWACNELNKVIPP